MVPVTEASPHNPAANPPTETRFHIALLDVLEDIRISSGLSLSVKLSHVCAGHNISSNAALCSTGTASGLAAHAAGLAVDIRPGSNSLDTIRKLWAEAKAAVGRFRTTCSDYSGAPSHSELQGNVQSIVVLADPLVAHSLDANQPLTAAQVRDFAMHLELQERERAVRWLTVIAPGTAATSAQISSGSIVGTFVTKEAADKERVAGTKEAWFSGLVWNAVVKTGSQATGVAVAGSNLVGYYNTPEQADAEGGGGSSWPEED